MTNITTLRPGEHFMFKGFEWVCLDPNHPDGGVMAIMAKAWAEDVKFCPNDKFADEKGNWNNYRTSNVRGILSDMANENDLIRRGDALKAIRKACISAHLPFDSATPEGQRVMDALYAVWKVKKRGKEA